MERIFLDLRHALRQLGKAPGFSITVLLTLALGIGATIAIFTLVYDVMLQPLTFPDSDRIVLLAEQVAEFRDIYPNLPVNANHFTYWQQNSHSFQSLAAVRHELVPLGTGGHPIQVKVVRATSGIFPVLKVAPQKGRPFGEAEAQPGHERVAVLMNDLWRTQFQSDPAIVGKTIPLNGFPYIVIGVMPPSFHLPVLQDLSNQGDPTKPVQVLVPKPFTKELLQDAMGSFYYQVLGRLKPGVTVAQANAEIDGLQHSISSSLPASAKATLSAALTPFQQALVGDNRTPLLILLAAVAGLLVVGCVNIGNLLLTRAVSQRQQLAIAVALGARPTELLRMTMREPMLLAAIGAALGVALAAVLVPVMQQFLPPSLNFRGPLHLEWGGAACALALAVGATLLAGAAPSWIGSRIQPVEAMRSDPRQTSESRSSKRLRRALVSAEVAVSVTLVLMTGLLTTSLVRLMRIHRGFDTEHVLSAEIELPRKSYDYPQARAAFYKATLDGVRRLPGVESAGIVSVAPLGGDSWIDAIRVTGETRPMMQLPSEHFRWISPGYFQAVHLPLVAGRFLEQSDDGKRFVLVSEFTARTLWPGQNVIGRQFVRASTPEAPFTVIGVVKDARTITLAQTDPMMIFAPYWIDNDSTSALLVRSHQDPASVADAVLKAVWSVDAAVSMPVVRTLDGVVADSVANRRFEMDLLLLFAISALLLAGLGVYGVVTYSVVQRQREIGVRLALGAPTANIYALVLRDGMMPVLSGAAAGVIIAASLGRLVSSLLFEVRASDPAIVVSAVGVLVAVGIAACLLPARRAAAIDPMRILKAE